MKVRTLASFARYVDGAILAPTIGAEIDVEDEVGKSLVDAGLGEEVAGKTPAARRSTKVTAPRETKARRPRGTKAAKAADVVAQTDPPMPVGPDGIPVLNSAEQPAAESQD